jgi:hypothetical protein
MSNAAEEPIIHGAELAASFEQGIDLLEDAIRRCPDDRWQASLWRVERTDPWVWPTKAQDAGTRTEEQIQVFSSFWMIAYHCLFFVDYYLWDGVGDWSTPPSFIGGPVDQGIGPDGAAVLPDLVYSREQLLDYVDYCRARARDVLGNLTVEQTRRICGPRHPRSGATFGQLLEVNLAHLREHGAQLRTAIPPEPGTP